MMKFIFFLILIANVGLVEAKVNEPSNCSVDLYALYKNYRREVLSDEVSVSKVFSHLSSSMNEWKDPVRVVEVSRLQEAGVLSVQAYYYNCDGKKGALYLKVKSFDKDETLFRVGFDFTKHNYKISNVASEKVTNDYIDSIGMFIPAN